MATIECRSAANHLPRNLEIRSRPDGELYLWVHSPDSDQNYVELLVPLSGLLIGLGEALRDRQE